MTRRLATLFAALPVCAVLPATAYAADEQPAASCPTYSACFEAVIANARAVETADELALMARMYKLRPAGLARTGNQRVGANSEAVGVDDAGVAMVDLLSDPNADFASRPEYIRVAALGYLKAGQPEQAIRTLKLGLQRMPSFTPFWLDIAKAYAALGDKEHATGALMVAYNWARQPDVLKLEYDKAAQGAGSMADVFRAALPLIALRGAALARLEAAAPPMASSPAPHSPGASPTLNRVELNQCKPEWPRSSLRYEETGKVTLAFSINELGQVTQAKIAQSSGHVELDHAALLGLAGCTFKPAIKDGQPVAARTKIQYQWTLE